MNQASMRKLAIEAALRTRIRQRIAQAAAKAADGCPCPLCTARRSGGGLIGLLRTLSEAQRDDDVTTPVPKSTPRH